MAGQNQLGAVLLEHCPQISRIGQAFAPADDTGCRRVMDQDNPKQVSLGNAGQNGLQVMQLAGADAANRQMRGAGPGGGYTDEGHTAPDAQAGENIFRMVRWLTILAGGIGDHVIGPAGHGLMPVDFNICIVVAGNDSNLRRQSQFLEPLPGFLIFGRKAQVGQIAGDGNVSGSGLPEIRY